MKINRALKLGEATIARIRGTSLDTATEQSELIVLDRGAASGEHTNIVAALVDAAERGERVSAIKSVKYIRSTGCRDVGEIIAASRTDFHGRATKRGQQQAPEKPPEKKREQPAPKKSTFEDGREWWFRATPDVRCRFIRNIDRTDLEAALPPSERSEPADEVASLRQQLVELREQATSLSHVIVAVEAELAAGRDVNGVTYTAKEQARLRKALCDLREIRDAAGLRDPMGADGLPKACRRTPTLVVNNTETTHQFRALRARPFAGSRSTRKRKRGRC